MIKAGDLYLWAMFKATAHSDSVPDGYISAEQLESLLNAVRAKDPQVFIPEMPTAPYYAVLKRATSNLFVSISRHRSFAIRHKGRRVPPQTRERMMTHE